VEALCVGGGAKDEVNGNNGDPPIQSQKTAGVQGCPTCILFIRPACKVL